MNDFDSIHNDLLGLTRTFERVFSNDEGLWRNYGSNFPKFNITESDEQFIIEAAVAGYGKKDLTVEIENDYLKITGTKANTEKTKKYHLNEIKSSSFNKSVYLPATIDREKIKVGLTDGILHIELPKVPEALPNKKVLEIE
jgi:HSP20 family protein